MPASSADAGGGEQEGREAHGGPGAMLFQAARALDLKDDQKAKVDAAEKTAHGGATEASREAMKTAAKDLHTDLVAGIRAGKIETSKLEPRYAAVEKVIGESQAKEAEALNALHAALDTTQRKAVAANVRAKQAMREEKMAHHEGMDGGGGGMAMDGGKAGWTSKRSVDRLTHGLDLDADQQKKVDAVVAKEDAAKPGPGRPDPAETKKNVEAMLTAFEKDTFDAKKLDMFDAKKARAPMEQEAKLLAQLVPILKPEQREKLAAKMEKGPSPHAARGAGFRPRPILEEPDED
jgi:Spy/CpxP family protein refolding chaperone